MAVAERLGRLGMIRLHEHRVALRQRHHEEPDLLLHSAKHDRRLAEVGLGVARRMGQRNKRLLQVLAPRANVIPHRRVCGRHG